MLLSSLEDTQEDLNETQHNFEQQKAAMECITTELDDLKVHQHWFALLFF